VAGEIVAGRYVVAACQRHRTDLARAGYDDHGQPMPAPSGDLRSPISDLRAAAAAPVWSESIAEAYLGFFEEVLYLKEDTPFRLDEFQAFIIGSLFGWHTRDELGQLRRRFRTAYIEIGKANGKTPLAAGIGLAGLIVDAEHAPEVYSFAAAKEQARICFDDAAQMVAASPELRGQIQILTGSLTIPRRHAVFRPLSSEDKGQHGKRVHIGIGDEIHAQNSAKILRAIVAGTKGRRNALIVLITNSGSDRQGICWKYHDLAVKVALGTMPKDDVFSYVCTLDPCPACLAAGKQAADPKCPHCDHLEDPATWIKANPRIADPEVRRYVPEREALKRSMPSEANDVDQLNGCTWTQSDSGWLNMYAWNNLCIDKTLTLVKFAGRTASIGMDAANKIDLTSLAAVFELAPGAGRLDPAALPAAAQAALAAAIGGPDALQGAETLAEKIRELAAAGYAIFWKHFLPADTIANADGPNHELYSEWQRAGHLIATPGARVSFAVIMEELRKWREQFSISRFSYDPREMSYFVEQLAAQPWCDFPLVEFIQSPQNISQPMKELEALTNAGLLRHDGDPVAAWAMGNVIQKSALTGSQTKTYFPARPAEHRKIDPAASAIMALDGALRTPAPTADPGVIFV
jgi:phage terminase large subunit-like protein